MFTAPSFATFNGQAFRSGSERAHDLAIQG